MSFIQSSAINSIANEKPNYDFPRFGSFKECPINPDVTGANTYTRVSNFEWYGGSLGVDGNIYCPPYGGSSILGINTKTQQCFTIPTGYAANQGWWGASVAHPNGKIYGIPNYSSSILEFDPINKQWSTFGSDTQSGNDKYSGGVVAPNGAIYCIPDDNYVNQVLKIDVYNRTLSYFGDTGYIGLFNNGVDDYGSAKFCNGVLGPDGKIYCIPQHARDYSTITTATFGSGPSTIDNYSDASTEFIIGIIDPDTDTLDTTSFRFTDADLPGYADSGNNWRTATGGDRVSYGFRQGVLGPDGKIYCIPYSYPWICVIDVYAKTITRMNNDHLGTVSGSHPNYVFGVQTYYNPSAYDGDCEFVGAKLAPNGKIYAFADNQGGYYPSSPTANKVLEIDCANSTWKYLDLPTLVDGKTYTHPFYFITTVMGPDGGLYGVPYFESFNAIVRSDVPSVYYPPGSCAKPNDWLLASNQNGYL